MVGPDVTGGRTSARPAGISANSDALSGEAGEQQTRDEMTRRTSWPVCPRVSSENRLRTGHGMCDRGPQRLGHASLMTDGAGQVLDGIGRSVATAVPQARQRVGRWSYQLMATVRSLLRPAALLAELPVRATNVNVPDPVN